MFNTDLLLLSITFDLADELPRQQPLNVLSIGPLALGLVSYPIVA